MESLVIIKGEKLPGEAVWVTSTDMYNVYDRIPLSIDGGDTKEMIIVDITEEGLFVQTVN